MSSRKSSTKTTLRQPNPHKRTSQKNTTAAKNKQTNPKQGLHPKNIHQGRYDLPLLCKALPDLSAFIIKNPNGEDTINFSNPDAVKHLNKALLIQYYQINYWDIPNGFLCPPIPSRADYIHHIAELLNTKNTVHALDIGTGANLIYPIIGTQSYGWQFTASDVDVVSIKNAQMICDKNQLQNKISLRHQTNSHNIFKGIINQQDYFDITLCNPPFHASLQEAMASNKRKQQNLGVNQKKRQKNLNSNLKTIYKNTDKSLNFGGQKAELWCQGGEIAFLKRMAYESANFCSQVGWFTTLISKSKNVAPLITTLNKLKVDDIKQIDMRHGQKNSRILAWQWHKKDN